MEAEKKQKSSRLHLSDEQIADAVVKTGLPKKQIIGICVKYEFTKVEQITDMLKYGELVPKMSFNQVRGALRKEVRKNTTREGFVAGEPIMWASVLGVILENTKTKENPNGRISSYVR